MKKKICSILFYIVAIILLGIYIICELLPHLILSEMGRIFLLCSSCLFIYFGGLLYSKYKKDKKIMKVNLWIFFFLYLVLLITLTMFDTMWGRNGINIFNWNKEIFNNYFKNSINLIPFKTIIEYSMGLFNSLLDRRTIFFNLFGNIACLMPMGLFIPLLFKRINTTRKFFKCAFLISLGIEIIQLIFCVGSCDIDDIILNTLGAVISYKILNIKDIKNLVRNIFLLEDNKVNKKNIIKVLIPIIIVLISLIGLYIISQNSYNSNLDDFISKRNYKIKIIDETEMCDEALEKFYENELYEYYFSCIKSDNVYAIINGKEKYLVKELLNNNPTDYIVSIDRFERAGLKFIEQEKYSKISITIKGDVGVKPKIENTKLFDVGYGDQIQDANKSSFEIFIIPKQTGESKLTLEFIDYMINMVVFTKEYIIKVDNDLKVEYKEVY